MPSGFSYAHDQSAVGTCEWVTTCSREYLLLQASAICPTASVTISGFSLRIPTKKPLTKPITMPKPRQATIAGARLWSDPAPMPAIKLPPSAITPGVERSMPAFMITSICPRAAIARTVA